MEDSKAMEEVLRNHPYPIPEQYVSNYGGFKNKEKTEEPQEKDFIVNAPNRNKEPKVIESPKNFTIDDLNLNPEEKAGFFKLKELISEGNLKKVRQIRNAMDNEEKIKFDLFIHSLMNETHPKLPESVKQFKNKSRQ